MGADRAWLAAQLTSVGQRVTCCDVSYCCNGDGTRPALHSSLLETIVKIMQIDGVARVRGGNHARRLWPPHATECVRTRPWYLRTKPAHTAPSAWGSQRERLPKLIWTTLSVATPPGAALTARRAYVGFGRPAVAVDGQSWIVSGLTWYKSPRCEPLSLWRFLSRRVDAILRISAALKGMCPLPIAGGEEWAALGWEKAPERVSSKFGSMLTQAFFGRTLDDSKKVIATAPASLSANFQNLRLGGRENLLFEATPNSDLLDTQLLLGAVVILRPGASDWH